MANSKTLANEATLEQLKLNESKGISTNQYTVRMYVPIDWISNPTEGIGISANFVNNEILRSIVFYCASNTIEKVNKTNVLLRLETSEHYLKFVFDIMKTLPKEAELKLGANKTSKE